MGPVFGELPEALRTRLCLELNLAKGWDYLKALPLPRRVKKSFLQAPEWILHLPAHENEDGFLKVMEQEGRMMLKVAGNIEQDVYQALLWAAVKGKLKCIVAGGAHGPAQDEAVFVKSAQVKLLYCLARLASKHPEEKTGFVWSGPERNLNWGEYSYGQQQVRLGERFLVATAMDRVLCDQGALGLAVTRPTEIITNYNMEVLKDKRVQPGEPMGREVSDGGLASGLKRVVLEAVSRGDFVVDPATLRAMSQEQWRDHVKSGHYPARRDCLQCTTYGATGHQHRRVSHPSLFVLNIDIAGPFRTLGANPHGRGRQERNRNLRYMLVAKYTLPESYITNELEETADDPEVEVPEGEADPFAEDEGGGVGLVEEEGIDWDDYEPDLPDDDGPVPDPEQAEDPDKEIVVGTSPREIPEDVKAPKAANLLFAHGLADIKGSTVASVVQGIVLYLRNLNLPVLRFHSDKAAQFTNKGLVQWLHGQAIRVTTSVPGIPQGNGGAEAAIKTIKQRARTALASAGLDLKFWPCAAEAVAAQQRAKALSQVSKLATTFGAKVMVKRRAFASGGKTVRREFEPRWVEGVYLGLSNSVDDGHLVYAEDSFLHTKNVKPKAALVDPGPPEVEPGDGVFESLAPHEGDEPCRGGDGSVRRRLTGKGPPRMARAVSGELVEVEQHGGDAVSEAEAFAREVLYEEWEITSEIVEELFELLPGDPPPRKCEERPGEDMEEEKAWSSGAFIRGGIGGLRANTRKFPYVTRVINRFIENHTAHLDSRWNSFVIFKNSKTVMHRDSHNSKYQPSYLVPISQFTKGGLWVEGVPEGETPVELKEKLGHIKEFVDDGGGRQPIVFLPRKWHATQEWEGNRLVVAAYSIRDFHRVKSEEQEVLNDLGFVTAEEVLDEETTGDSGDQRGFRVPQHATGSGGDGQQQVRLRPMRMTTDVNVLAAYLEGHEVEPFTVNWRMDSLPTERQGFQAARKEDLAYQFWKQKDRLELILSEDSEPVLERRVTEQVIGSPRYRLIYMATVTMVWNGPGGTSAIFGYYVESRRDTKYFYVSWVEATREEYIHETEMTRALQELPTRGAASTVPAGPARPGAIMSNNTTFTVNPRERSRSRDQEPRDPSSSVRLNKFTGPNPHALPLQPVNRRMELITRFVRLQEDEYERWEANVHSGQEVIDAFRGQWGEILPVDDTVDEVVPMLVYNSMEDWETEPEVYMVTEDGFRRHLVTIMDVQEFPVVDPTPENTLDWEELVVVQVYNMFLGRVEYLLYWDRRVVVEEAPLPALPWMGRRDPPGQDDREPRLAPMRVETARENKLIVDDMMLFEEVEFEELGEPEESWMEPMLRKATSEGLYTPGIEALLNDLKEDEVLQVVHTVDPKEASEAIEKVEKAYGQGGRLDGGHERYPQDLG